MEWLTTSTLLERLRSFEDEDVWTLVVDTFQDPVVALARRMGLGHAQAQDAAQETLLAFARSYKAGKFDRSKGRLKDWLFGIAQRQILRARLGERFDPPTGTARAEDRLVDDGLAEVWEEEWRWAVYERALRQVASEATPETMRIFELLVSRRMPVDDVCARLHVTRATVYNAKHRIVRRIAELVTSFEDECM